MKYESDFDPVPPVKEPVSVGLVLLKGKYDGNGELEKAMRFLQHKLKAQIVEKRLNKVRG